MPRPFPSLAVFALTVFFGAQACQIDDPQPPEIEARDLSETGLIPIPLPGGGPGGIGGIGSPLPQTGFRWDPVWDALVPPRFMTGADGLAKVNPTSSPALVGWGGFGGFGGIGGVADTLQAFYRADASGELVRVAEGMAPPQRAGITGLTSSPAVVAHDGNVDVLFTMTEAGQSVLRLARWNGTIFVAFPGGKWPETLPFESGAVTPAVTATPVVDSGRLVTRLDVFYSDPIGQLLHGYRVGAGPWTRDAEFPFERLPGYSASAVLAPPAAVARLGRIDLAFRGPDRTIYRTTMSPRTCASCWSDLEALIADAASGPAIAVGGTRTDVFAVLRDGHVYQRRSVTGGWGPLLKRAECTHPTAPDMTALLKAKVPYAAPSAFGDVLGRVDLAIWGTDGNLWRDAWTFGALIGIVPRPPPCTCGTAAGTCCEDGSCGGGLVCAGGLCGECGTRDGGCCAASSCNPSLECVAGKCVCGGRGETCCESGCSAGLVCDRGACACGGEGQPCCGGSSCSSQALVCTDGTCVTPPPPSPFATTFDILASSCGGCHGTAGPGPFFYGGGMAATHARLVGVITTKRPPNLRVTAGDPAASDLWIRVESNDMPRPPVPALNDAEKATIFDWIKAGAKL